MHWLRTCALTNGNEPLPRPTSEQVVRNLVLVGFLGGGCGGLMAAAVLPSLAAHELREDTAAVVRGAGHAITRCVHVCARVEQHKIEMCTRVREHKGRKLAGLCRCMCVCVCAGCLAG